MGENRQIINPALDHAGGGLQVSDMDRLHQVAPLRQEKVPPVSTAKPWLVMGTYMLILRPFSELQELPKFIAALGACYYD